MPDTADRLPPASVACAAALLAGARPALLLLGAGGHAKVVAETALRLGHWGLLRAADRDPARSVGELLPGIALLHEDAAWGLDTALHVTLGNNRIREREALRWGTARLVTLVHPAAQVSAYASLGAGCFVAAGAVVAPCARLGLGCIVNHLAVVDHDNQVGDFCHIAPGASLAGEVRLGHRVMVGAGARLLPGVQVPDDTVIGAGAVVTHTLPLPGTYVGVPARRLPDR